ncbi:LysR family transcriptional regulator ArgP [Terasakiella sp. A23]|uniref:LysR family transcriptional regulator ArgP n=1 Tax=Terasakiella sp. FCG-A23 TaxID=3080561 RepID=UPI0029535B4F|nr:LysR family transcriptional regulator ArgP [Terasakiella sp. A23]MDV7338876.1 LysR family transcriptional regulator ArgP [Terasakiella sp. A23]
MLDYKLVEAVSAVIRLGSFEKAAQELGMTQSAISQRIKLLEERVAQPLVVRSKPIKATDAGARLYRHFQHVNMLEQEILSDLPEVSEDSFKRVSLAVNADSLATWFVRVAEVLFLDYNMLVDISTADENKTLDLLKQGTVMGAVSTQDKRIQGCKVAPLGAMRYVPVARLDFISRYFPDGVTPAALRKAPAVIFGRDDDMHEKFLKQNYRIASGEFPCHVVPSSEGFVNVARTGMAYALVAENQVRSYLEDGELVKICDKEFIRPLYLHSHNIDSTLLKSVVEMTKAIAQMELVKIK